MHLQQTLLPNVRNLRLDSIYWSGSQVRMAFASISSSAACPRCGRVSRRIHSHYHRHLDDLPLQGISVSIHWHSRRFFCDNAGCTQRIFTERLPEVAAKHGRKTQRLVMTLRALAMECGGEAGSRLAARLGLPTSPSTLLREIRRSAHEPAVKVRVLGVDDWAIRRGQRYGTILVDLEAHRTIDLLPERSAESFAAWLVKHPEVEIISRDRGEYYITGANNGAPKAIQVTDRWHLLHNVHEVLTRMMEGFPTEVSRVARTAFQVPVVTAAPPATPPPAPAAPPPEVRLSVAEQRYRKRRARWEDKYQRAVELRGQNYSLRKIARELHLDRDTVRRWLQVGGVPESKPQLRHRVPDAWADYLTTRWQNGCHNATELFQELEAQGFKGSYHSVRRFVASWGATLPVATQVRQRRPKVSPKVVSWWLLLQPADRTTDQQKFIDALSQACPKADQAATLAREFSAVVRKGSVKNLHAWFDRVQGTADMAEMQRFAKGLREDLAAVEAALQLPWSNGQTEGQVNRVKLIKRQMFGRAKFDLLRQRVLGRSA